MNLYDLLLARTLSGGGGGGDVSVVPLNVDENGVYSAPTGTAYSPVNVSVPSGVQPSGTYDITQNGIYNVASYASASVNVPQGVVPSGTYNITQNGIYNVTNYASASVNVSGGGEDLLAKNLDGTLSGAYTYNGSGLVKTYAFVDCSMLTEINCPNVYGVGECAFKSCTSLKSASFPECTVFDPYAFQDCEMLKSMDCPSCVTIGSSAFTGCLSLSTASFPECNKIYTSAFTGCSELETVYFPKVHHIGNFAFQRCRKLSTVSFPELSSTIGSSAFFGCSKLESMYLLGSTIPSLKNNAFANTPMSDSSYLGYFGSIYVPSSLVSTYQGATNWVTYSDRITAYNG